MGRYKNSRGITIPPEPAAGNSLEWTRTAPSGKAKDPRTTTASCRFQPGRAANAPGGPSTAKSEGPPHSRTSGKPQHQMAGNSIQRAHRQKGRRTILHHSQRQPTTGKDGELHPQGSLPEMAGHQPSPPHPAAGPNQEWRGTAPAGPSARNGQGPPPPHNVSGRPLPGMAGNCTEMALRQDWPGATRPT